MATAPPLRPPAQPARTPAPERPAAAVPRTRAGARAGSRLWPGPGDRDVLLLYVLTRAGIWATAYGTRWLFAGDRTARDVRPALSSWNQWDAWHYLRIARDGYFPGGAGPGTDGWDNREAFFPGFPLVLRAVHVVVPDWTAAALLVSFVSGAVAVLALARVAGLHLPDSALGRRAVLFFLLSPCAVFLAAGYTEALFLALALPAWLAARRHNWPLAGILACLATGVRVSGLFLAAAIAVHFVTTTDLRRRWRSLPWVALPALPAALYVWFLHAHTGDWMAWHHAQERGWYRNFHAPWEAWQHTWTAAFSHTQSTGYAVVFQAELLAMAVGLLLLGLLLRRRRWPEAVYIGLTLWALGTSYWYTSIPRATLLWWPMWVLLAAWSLRRPWVRSAYLCVVAPVATVLTVTFLSGRWAG
ncbi:mannosyltransferase family protein [Streptomyces sp. Wb2n-11]|uniref:mannosyltransferase family protein n=1 Tax=Streptomyces sp. Wb2n-11 TaxID=1030533 RepID=UPI000A61F7EA|nr:mannosyltransferase family protein [Streptomyces sp. Wb2n-11]